MEETIYAGPTVTANENDIFTYGWLAIPIIDFACGSFNYYYFHEDVDMDWTVISHVYYTEWFVALF